MAGRPSTGPRTSARWGLAQRAAGAGVGTGRRRRRGRRARFPLARNAAPSLPPARAVPGGAAAPPFPHRLPPLLRESALALGSRPVPAVTEAWVAQVTGLAAPAVSASLIPPPLPPAAAPLPPAAFPGGGGGPAPGPTNGSGWRGAAGPPPAAPADSGHAGWRHRRPRPLPRPRLSLLPGAPRALSARPGRHPCRPRAPHLETAVLWCPCYGNRLGRSLGRRCLLCL